MEIDREASAPANQMTDAESWPLGKCRYIHLFLSVFQCLSCAGVVFGWVALLPILKNDGIYSEYCDNLKTNSTTSTPPPSSCASQDNHFHSAYTIATSANMMANLFLGIFFDKFGPRNCKFVSLLLVLVGTICMAKVETHPSFDFLIPGLSLIGFGGTGILLASVHYCNLFPEYKSAVSCIIAGAFQLSIIVFSVFSLLYSSYNITRAAIFSGYSVVILLNVIITYYIEPNEAYQLGTPGHRKPKTKSTSRGLFRMPSVFKKGKNALTADTPQLANYKRMQKKALAKNTEVSPLLFKSAKNVDLRHRSFKTKLFSAPYIILVLNMCIGTLWCNFDLGNMYSQLMMMPRASKSVTQYISYFNLIVPAGGLCIPIIGWAVEVFGFIACLVVSTVLALLYTVFIQFDSFPMLMLGFAVYAIYRTILFSIVFAYLSHKFGFQHFGVLSGILFLSTSLVGFLQIPIAASHDYDTIFITQMASYAFTFSLPIYEYYQLKSNYRKERLDFGAV